MKPPLTSFRLKNFKAVRDSGVIKFTPLTVFIGNNGSGKSSLIEGLRTYQSILTQGLDDAMAQWRGFEYIRNAAVPHTAKPVTKGRDYETNPIGFKVNYRVSSSTNPFVKDEPQSHSLSVSSTPNGDEVFIYEEALLISGKKNLTRTKEGVVLGADGRRLGDGKETLMGGEFLITDLRNDFGAYRDAYNFIQSWQFVLLNPLSMGNPKTQKRSGGAIRLDSSGANIAEYLLDIRNRSPEDFQGIIDTLQDVLPYARDVQPTLTSELERAVYLQLSEENFKIPGWLLSTGTLRVLALLALFRHPSPPPLIVIEEIENGLDPNTIHLIIDEISRMIKAGKSQVIFTTHSPFLLDFLSIDHIVLVERVENKPTFYRPVDEVQLGGWKDHFRVGQLYTSGRLRKK